MLTLDTYTFSSALPESFSIETDNEQMNIALLLFRSGDVYKCYEEDAIKVSEVLCLTNIVEEDKITIASFPHHALDSYLPRLIRAGHRIAICDQLEAPKPKKQAQMELFLRS